MRKIREVLRLTHDAHLNTRQVALSLNISRSTVTNYQQRAEKAGLSWPLPEDLKMRWSKNCFRRWSVSKHPPKRCRISIPSTAS
jgi:transposase